MRWDYFEPGDLSETNARQAVIDRIDAWWEAFVCDADQLDQAFSSGGDFDVAGFTNRYLKSVNSALCWEYGEGILKPGHRLVITPEGTHHLNPMVREMLCRAPELAGWEFYPCRIAEPPAVAVSIAEQVSGFRGCEAASIHVELTTGEFRRIDLRFHVPGVRPGNDEALSFVVKLTEHLLGETVLDHWVGVIELTEGPSLFGRLTRRAQKVRGIPLDRLKPTVDSLIQASLEQLPKRPRRHHAGQAGIEEPTGHVLELKPARQEDYPRRSDLLVATTDDLELWQASCLDPVFFSGRFSRVDETFCYLKLHGRQANDRVKDRYATEEALDAALAEQELGGSFGGGSGLTYSYIDLALTDVRRAIPVIRKVLSSREVDRRSWLLFFDAELRDEWVGIYENSPPPPSDPSE